MTEGEGRGYEGLGYEGLGSGDEMIGMPGDETLDVGQIRERTEALRMQGFPTDDVVDLVEDIVARASGPEAEAALARLIEQLEPPSLNALVKAHLMDPEGPGTPDWTIRPGNEMAIRLSELGFEVRAGGTGKWTVTLEDGEQLVRTYGSGADRGDALCRLGLLARWIDRMRERDEDAPEDERSTGAA